MSYLYVDAAKCSKAMSQVPRCSYSLLFLLLFGVMSPAFGKDLNVLIRVLYAAFIAEQGSAMCMVPSINLSEGDRTVFINAHNYAQWIKQRVSASLRDDEIQFVLKSAAERARGEMLEVVKVLKSNPPDREYVELFRWCTTNMKPIADKVVHTYVDNPEGVNKLIEDAKHD
jgi:hypothetical protein